MPFALETLTGSVSLPKAWPPGRYRVDTLVGAEVLSSVQFVVVGRASCARFAPPLRNTYTVYFNDALH